jgi:hypothetical protein
MRTVLYEKPRVFNERLFRLLGWEVWWVGKLTDIISFNEGIGEYEAGVYLCRNGGFRGWIVRPSWALKK